MLRPFFTSLAAMIALAGCDNGANPWAAEMAALRDSMVLLSTEQDIQVLKREATEIALVGCAGQARNALTTTLDQIVRAQAVADEASMAEAWNRVEAYRGTAEACESTLAG